MKELTIEADRIDRQYWKDLWAYRELFYFLVWRDFLVRYKQTVVGLAWSLIRPLITMLVLTLIFGKFGKMPSGGSPYPLLVLCGTLPWQFFSTSLSESANSLISNSNLITKVYFPRLALTASSVITCYVDFVISSLFLVVLMFWYHFIPPATIWLLPLFLIPMVGVSLGAGLWTSAMMVEYRDFRFIIPFVVQFGLYLSPVGFESSVVPAQYRLLYSLNPMVGVIDGFRWCLLGGPHTIYWPSMACSAIGVLILLVTGVWYFRRTELTFADVI